MTSPPTDDSAAAQEEHVIGEELRDAEHGDSTDPVAGVFPGDTGTQEADLRDLDTAERGLHPDDGS